MTHYLKEWREHRRLTQDQLGRLVIPAVGKDQISKLETGTRGLGERWVKRLAKALQIEPGALFAPPPHENANSHVPKDVDSALKPQQNGDGGEETLGRARMESPRVQYLIKQIRQLPRHVQEGITDEIIRGWDDMGSTAASRPQGAGR